MWKIDGNGIGIKTAAVVKHFSERENKNQPDAFKSAIDAIPDPYMDGGKPITPIPGINTCRMENGGGFHEWFASYEKKVPKN
jgi:hypothetical protein